MKKIFILLAIIVVAASSCQRVPSEGDLQDLYGSWTNCQYLDSLRIYTKANFLPSDDYGFTFVDNGIFYERKNIGWCGTPPITYGDYEGTWQIEDSLITVTVPYWGGTATYRWKLVSVTSNELTIFQIYE